MMSQKMIVTQSYCSGSGVRPSVNAANTCIPWSQYVVMVFEAA